MHVGKIATELQKELLSTTDDPLLVTVEHHILVVYYCDLSNCVIQKYSRGYHGRQVRFVQSVFKAHQEL